MERTLICKIACPVPGELLAKVMNGICREFEGSGWTDVSASHETLNGINFLIVTAIKPRIKRMN